MIARGELKVGQPEILFTLGKMLLAAFREAVDQPQFDAAMQTARG